MVKNFKANVRLCFELGVDPPHNIHTVSYMKNPMIEAKSDDNQASNDFSIFRVDLFDYICGCSLFITRFTCHVHN